MWKLNILALLLLSAHLIACSNKTDEKTMITPTKQEDKAKAPPLPPASPCKEDTERLKDFANRKYKFPSIMAKGDMYSSICIDGKERQGLLLTSFLKWDVVRDKYGRLCQYVSPEMTYADLQNALNFNDEDVVFNKEPKPGEPQASIKIEWLTLNITFLGKVYDGQDKTVRLKAVVIDNKQQAEADKEAEYDKNKGVIRKILDFFVTSPH
jgi:hypothetical protein